ncbi:MAG TPA: CTP synthase [Candidatus Saccharimonadales bacterium]|nr:CTP synthase [Candidatus Saccharimonadales bacterium]
MRRGVQTQYIFVTGGVLSGLGKGITAASIGAILQARGLNISIQKCDPYLNVDAGTLNPAEHGECFVTDDGAETDLDLGHYERFLDIDLTQASSTMSGRLLRQLTDDERAGKFLGQTVQLVPHFTNAIQDAIRAAGKGSDMHIVEIGGTVGDIESLAFIEAIREFALVEGRENCIYAHLVYVPYLGTSKEFKTKPAQNSIRDLRGIGISPDILLVRTETEPSHDITSKIQLFGGLAPEQVVVLPNAKSVYQVPITLEEHGIGTLIMKKLDRRATPAKMDKWHKLVKNATTDFGTKVSIGVVAKYLDNEDTYFSVVEALKSATRAHHVNLELTWIDAEKLTDKDIDSLQRFDGLVVPGGFGKRGIEGKIAAADYAMSHDMPYLGLCLGMQVAVIAAARAGGLHEATSTEFDLRAQQDVVYIMPDQKGKEATGGSMRLGSYECQLEADSRAAQLYKSTHITERHRHRYEVNKKFTKYFESVGMQIVGTSPNGKLVEMIEMRDHPFFLATQAHPELKSRPDHAHPLFDGLISAAIERSAQTTMPRSAARSFVL